MQSTTQLSIAERARRRISIRLIPFLLLLYFLAFIDRTNLGVATLNMRKSIPEGGLGFTDDILGAGAGIFFIGYFLLEVPGTLIVERWSARKWIARIMISWGIIAVLMGFIGKPWFFSMAENETQFYVLRFILGLAEAGFFPGVVVYLSHWFRYEDRARAKSHFMIGLPIATVVGVPISHWIMRNVTWGGYEGWRWVFILEGIPSVLLGIITIFFLTDKPKDAKWLPEDEKQWIVDELARERKEKLVIGDDNFWKSTLAALNLQTFHLAFIYLFVITGYYGLIFFIPSITAKMKGTSVVTQTMVTMLPYILGVFAMLLNGAHSDKTGERRFHTALPILIGGAAMAFAVLSGDNFALTVICFGAIGIGIHGYMPVFWTWPSSIMTASTAAASVGLINSIGNLGGYVGPIVVGKLSKAYGSYVPGMWFMVVSILMSGTLAMFLRQKQRDKKPVDAAY